jgi:signal transduction histidine kinase
VRLHDLARPRPLVNATLAAGIVATAVVAALVGGRLARFEPSLYVAFETTAALAGLLAAYLVFFRYHLSARLGDLLLAAGLVILSLANLVYGVAPAAFDQAPHSVMTWAAVSGRLLGSAVLAAAAFAPPRVLERPRLAAALALVASVLALALLGTILWLVPFDSNADDAALALQLALLAVLCAAAVGFVRRAEAGDDLMRWFAVAATLGALAALNKALHPSLEWGWIYTGDAFRLLLYCALVAGAAQEIRRYWQESLEAAVLQERRRIARDLHDGLAQELAFIVRRAARALQQEPNSPIARQLVSAAERALDESRRVIAALTRPLDEPLDVVLAQAVKDVADRVGTIAALALDRGVRVTPDTREALVRIAREAVTNAARHGQAGIVRVELEDGNGHRLLRISDDGYGFDPSSVQGTRSGGFGLVSMAERAQAVGAVLRVDSRVGVGTTVEVELP